LKMTKQYITPSNKMRTSKATLDNYPTNKLDPTIGSTRKENRDRNPVGKTELSLTTSSISKSNGSEHSKLTKEKEQYDTKQADKDKESQETSKHPSNNVPNITVAYRHTGKQRAPIKQIDASTTSTITRINTSELSVMNTPISNKTPFPETTQKLSATEITLGYTSPNLTALEVVTTLTVLLVTHFTITYQFQEQLIWLQSLHSMNLLHHLRRHLPTSLEPLSLRKKEKNELRYKTNKMYLTQGKALRLPEQGRQHDAWSANHNTTSRSRESRNTNTKPKSEPPNQRLGTTTLDNHSNTIGRGINTQIGSRNTTSRICTIWTERSGQPRTRNDKHTEYRTNYNHHWSHIPHHLALNPHTRRRPPSRTFKRYKQLIGR
jgi:hypothetical protein